MNSITLVTPRAAITNCADKGETALVTSRAAIALVILEVQSKKPIIATIFWEKHTHTGKTSFTTREHLIGSHRVHCALLNSGVLYRYYDLGANKNVPPHFLVL